VKSDATSSSSGLICASFDRSPVLIFDDEKLWRYIEISGVIMVEIIDIYDMTKIGRRIPPGRTCYKCEKSDTYIDSDGCEHWAKHRDEKGKWTGHWLCNTCRMATDEMKKYYKERYDEIKYVRDCRNGRIDITKERCKGCIGAQICAKTLGVNILNIEMDNFRYYVDLSKHPNYGYCEVKTATFNKRDGRWYFHDIHKEKFDTLLLTCMDQYSPWDNVLKMYAIPTHKITTSTTITIYDNPSRKTWYEEFDVDAKPFNGTYQDIDINKCPVLEKYNK